MIPYPALDDIAFDALVDEGRALIPRFAPDWTDHNLHDPGITLLDLLAWIVDQQVYRIGTVGDAHLRAFAALLGVHPLPAQPAHGLLWPNAEAPPADLALPRGTRAWPTRTPDLIFTIVSDLRLSGAGIEMVARTPLGRKPVRPDRTAAIRLPSGTDGLELGLDRPFSAAPEVPSTLALGLEFATALPELPGAGPLPVAFDYRTDDGVWHRADVRWVEAGSRRAGAALIEIPGGRERVSAIRLDLVGFAVRVLPTRVALDVLPLVQIETLAGIALGAGSGLPDLELPLGAVPLSAAEASHNPLVLRTLESPGPVEWRRIGDFTRAGPEDSVYVLDEARGTIVFGNGVNGRVPPLETAINRDALDVTAGADGNVVGGTDWRVEGIAAGARAWTNRDLMLGGCDASDRDALLAALRKRSQDRTAMLRDPELRDAAMGLEGFGLDRAEVLARFLPTLQHRSVPGARTLLLHPAAEVDASDAWVEAVERRLAPRRVLGERLAVAAAEPVAIDVTAELLVAAGTDARGIEQAAQAALRARLSASGTSGPIPPWPSGRPVTIGELEALVASVDGVLAVPQLRIGARGEAPAEMSITLARTEVAVAGAILVTWQVEGRHGPP
jgi:uncharacterized phage protein gp47/JayE